MVADAESKEKRSSRLPRCLGSTYLLENTLIREVLLTYYNSLLLCQTAKLAFAIDVSK